MFVDASPLPTCLLTPTHTTQLRVCKDMSAWARAEKRTFLRQRIDARVAALLIARGDAGAALDVVASLLAEVKRLDDKLLLVDVHLLETRARRALRDGAKARAALTAARAAASATYVPPSLQADVDALSGTLHADEKDYRTAFSYFYEAFDALSTLDPPRAAASLKHMLLCKVMVGDAAGVPGIIAAKAGSKFAGPGIDALAAVAAAYASRSLADLDAALAAHGPSLRDDDVVAAHIDALADGLLQRNLARLVEPFDRVEVAHLASLLALPVETVLAKLSQMILDGALDGTLDAGAGVLEVFPEADSRGGYDQAKKAFAGLGRAVDALFARSQKLSA